MTSLPNNQITHEQLETAALIVGMHMEDPDVSQEVREAFILIAEYVERTLRQRQARLARMSDFMKSSMAELEKYGVETMGDLPPESQSALESLLVESLIEPDDDIRLRERG